VNRTAVKSSNVAAVGYDGFTQTLEVEFKSGGIYRYHDVPSYVHDQLMQADSKGHFVNVFVKGKYDSKRVEEEVDGQSPTTPLTTEAQKVSKVQALHLDLLRRTSYNSLDGERVADSLLANRELWHSAVMANSAGLGITLRDMAADDTQVDTLYILCDVGLASTELVRLAFAAWGADEVELQHEVDHEARLYSANVNDCLGGNRVVLAVWWD
jgi:hypothetical protein